MHTRLRTLRRVGAALILLIALLGGMPVLAEDIVCYGTVGRIEVDNVRVPRGATCTMNETIVDGNIEVEEGATLRANAVRVDGNIQAEDAARVDVLANSFVGGNIQIFQSGAADITAVTIDGDLQLEENAQFT